MTIRSSETPTVLRADLEPLARQVNRLFDEFTASPVTSGSAGAAAEGWRPVLDVTESERDVKVTTEVPGVAADDLKVSLSGSSLTIRGEKRRSEDSDSESAHWAERGFGSFRRTVALPASVDSSRVDARYAQGVLTVSVAKTEASQARDIRVESA